VRGNCGQNGDQCHMCATQVPDWGWEAIWSIVRRMIRCPPSGNYELISRTTPVSRADRGGLDTFTSPNSTDLMTPRWSALSAHRPSTRLSPWRSFARSCVAGTAVSRRFFWTSETFQGSRMLTPMTCFLQQESIRSANFQALLIPKWQRYTAPSYQFLRLQWIWVGLLMNSISTDTREASQRTSFL